MNVGMGGPQMNVKITETGNAHHSENVNMNMNMGFGGPGMNVKVTETGNTHHSENVNMNMNMGFGGPTMNMKVSGNAHNPHGPDHVDMSIGGGHHDNTGFGMNFTTNDSHDNIYTNHSDNVNVNFKFNGDFNNQHGPYN